MFEFFPGNYRWSYNTLAAVAAGGQVGDVSLILDRLRERDGNDEAWHREWSWLAGVLENRAEDSLASGASESAAEHYFLASLYHTISEHFVPPAEPLRLECYRSVLETFEKGRALSSHNIERVLVPYDAGANLPAYFIPATEVDSPGPAAIFLCGLDTTKEISSLRVRDRLAARGISCLAVDTPGIGEALRLGKLPTRYDYEVPVAAAIDYLQSRPDVDPNRIGIIGSSLGGYYVARAAAFEPRLRAAVAWGAIYDYHAVWRRRMTVGGAVATASFQLMFITGTDSVDAAMERIEHFKVQPIGGQIQCPFLVVHGSEDQQVPAGDAEKMFDAIGSTDKSLMICDGRNAGAAHCQFDNHLPAMLSVADWLHTKLATPAGP
jgi:dienelactone hydrolase